MDNKAKYNTGNVAGDAEIARASEELAIKVLSRAFKEKKFESLHDDISKRHWGDILMTIGEEKRYIDVKDDGKIHRSGNVFCENYKYYKRDPNNAQGGFMRTSNYDYLAVLDQVDGNLYILDFKKLQKIYRKYPPAPSYLSDCTSWGNLVPLRVCEREHILKCTIKFCVCDEMVFINQVLKDAS